MAQAPRSVAGNNRQLLIIGGSIGAVLIVACCGGVGFMAFLGNKLEKTARSEATKPDAGDAGKAIGPAPVKQAEAIDRKQPEKTAPTKVTTPVEPVPVVGGIAEWKYDNGRVDLYSDSPIPVLYGVPKGVIKQMSADQLSLIEAIEKLGDDANKSMKEVADNPVLKSRLIKTINSKAFAITSDVSNPAIPKPKITAIKGWAGQIRLGSETSVSIGRVRSLNPHDPFYEYDIKQGMKKPPQTVYRSEEPFKLITIVLETKLMSDKGLEQFRSLKDGDWVKVDLFGAQVAMTPLVSFAEKKNVEYAVYGSLTVREFSAEMYKRPRTNEPVVQKIAVTD